MGIQNTGAQTILWRFQTPLVGSDLAQVNAGVLYEGIYTGLVASHSSGAIISVTPGNCLIFDHASYGTASAKLVKVVFGTSFTFNCNTSTTPRYVVIRFTWEDALENYADIINTDTVEPYDLVLCTLEWNGSVISSVDSGSASKGFRVNFDAVINNLRPSVDFNGTRSVAIAPGKYVYGKTSIIYAGGTVSLDLSSHVNGRYDIVGLNSAGNVVVSKGTEGGSPPVLGDYLPVCQVFVRNGATKLRMVDIIDIRPYLTFSGVLPADAVTVNTVSAVNLPTNLGYIQDFIDWFDDSCWTTPTFNALALSGSQREEVLTSDDHTKIPTSGAVSAYVAAAVAAVNSDIRGDAVKVADTSWIDIVSKVSFVLSRNVGKVSWFPFYPGTGWLRANGQVINKSTYPLYATLVDKLKEVAGDDAGHPFYDANVNQARLPDLRDRYAKDVGTSDRDIGSFQAGELREHNHTVTIQSSQMDSHTHTIAHTHSFPGNQKTEEGGGVIGRSVTVNAHSHLVNLSHIHKLQSLEHSHGVYGREGTRGSGGAQFLTDNHTTKNTTKALVGDYFTATLEEVGGGLITTPRRSHSEGATGSVDLPTHDHVLPDTLGPKAGGTSTGIANPSAHGHTGTIANAGTASQNDVDNVALMAYIFYGYHPAS